jgi:choline-sulfatase
MHRSAPFVRFRLGRLWALAPCLLAAAGCGASEAHREGPGEARARASQGATATEGAAGAGPAAPMRVHYDLGAAPERAQLFEGDTLTVPLGADEAAQYTLGGWRTGVAPAVVDGAPVGVVLGTRGTLWVPWEGEGAAALTLRGRALAPGPVVIALNGEALEGEALPRDDFGTVRFTVPEGRLRRGDNTLTIRARRVGQLDDGRRASVALDWVRIGPASDGHREGPAKDLGALFGDGEVTSVRIPAGSAVAWTTKVPEGARLRGVARGAGRLAVEAQGDEGRHRPCAAASGPIDCALDAGRGKIWRIALRAQGGDVEVLAPAVVVPGAEPEASEVRRPKHVLLYLVDTLRADKLAPYRADTRVETPGLVQFAQRAATFHNARAPENWTKPSVATLLSSLMPWEHTAQTGNAVLPESVTILPERLAAEGFFTGSFIANGYVSDRFGFKQGWNTYRNYIRESRRSASEFVAADVLGWLDRRPEDKPFFLYVHTIDPHVPYRPREPFLSNYADPGYRGGVSFRRDATLLEKIKTGKMRVGAADKAHLEALYDGEISYHDVHFTAILRALEERGLADDTLVIVTSDHGEEFWDHGSVGHGHNMYDELLRVPFFIHLPGVTEGQDIRTHVGLVDVVPTVLDALGMPVPDDLAGRSLLPLLQGARPAMPTATVSAFLDNWRSVAVDDLKLLQRADVEGRLYDLVDDAAEQKDVADARPVSLRHARATLGLNLQAHDTVVATAPRRRQPRKPRPQHRRQEVDLDDETKAQLRALGYIH